MSFPVKSLAILPRVPEDTLTVVNAAGGSCDGLHLCNPVQHLACLSGTCQASGTGDAKLGLFETTIRS